MIQYNKLIYLIHSRRPYILQKFYWRSNKWIKFKIRCFGIVLSQFPILRLSEIGILWISGQIKYYDRLSHAPSYKISTFCIRSGSRLHCNASFPFCCYIFSPDDLWYPSLLYIIPLVRVYFVWSWLLTSIQQDQQVIMMRKCSMSVGSKTLWTLLRLGGCHLSAMHSKGFQISSFFIPFQNSFSTSDNISGCALIVVLHCRRAEHTGLARHFSAQEPHHHHHHHHLPQTNRGSQAGSIYFSSVT